MFSLVRAKAHLFFLPAGKMRAAGLPFLALAVGSKNKCAFARTNENTDLTHDYSSSLKIFRFTAKPSAPRPARVLDLVLAIFAVLLEEEHCGSLPSLQPPPVIIRFSRAVLPR